MIGMAMQAMRNEAVGRAMIGDFELAERKWLARICRALGAAHHEVFSDTLLLMMHGANFNPWRLDRAHLGAQYSATAGAIVKLVGSQSERDEAGPDVGVRGVVHTKQMEREASRKGALDVH